MQLGCRCRKRGTKTVRFHGCHLSTARPILTTAAALANVPADESGGGESIVLDDQCFWPALKPEVAR